MNNTSLESLTIGSGVTALNLRENVLRGCTNLSTIVVDSNNTKYDSRDNCNAIIETATNTLVAGCKSSTVPNTVVKIANNAFRRNAALATLNTNNVTEVGTYSFADTGNMTSIVCPNVTNIGEGAFYAATNLISADISSATSLGKQLFYQCSSLTSVTLCSTLQSISQGCFYSCTNLTSITIPQSVTSIGSNAFYGCSGLTSVTIPNSVTSIGGNAFEGCTSLELSSISLNDITSIGASAFKKCKLTGTLTIPATLTTIGNNLFYEVNKSPNSKNGTVIFQEGVTTIPYGTFSYAALNQVELPSTVTKLKENTFYQAHVTNVIIKAANPPTLEQNALLGTINNIYVPSGSVDAYKAASGWSSKASVIQAIPTT